MAIGVQTDMATPALARFGSDELETRVPGAGHRRRVGGLHRRQRARRRQRRRRRARPPRARTATITSSTARRCGSPTACRPTGCACWSNTGEGPGAQEQVLIMVPMTTPGIDRRRRRSARSACTGQRHRPDPLRRRARAAAPTASARKAWASSTRCMQFQEERLWAAASAFQGLTELHRAGRSTMPSERKVFGAPAARQAVACTSGWPSSRPRSRRCAR